ncbi:MAG: zinc-binding dehydrogenase, partial [Hominenteromicrobium sp.]
RFARFAHARRTVVGVWGDGNLSYITSLLLKKTFPEIKVCVFGIVRDKLADFSFADETCLTNEIPKGFAMDHAFECVGGNGSPVAIGQIIDYIRPEGTISILGVSEYPVQINTRMILEKGLMMFGSSRSGRADFLRTIELYQKSPEVVDYLSNLIGREMTVRTVRDISSAFEADARGMIGKTIMKWEE